MDRYGHVLVKAFTERSDGPGLEATVVNYKELHNQVSGTFYLLSLHTAGFEGWFKLNTLFYTLWFQIYHQAYPQDTTLDKSLNGYETRSNVKKSAVETVIYLLFSAIQASDQPVVISQYSTAWLSLKNCRRGKRYECAVGLYTTRLHPPNRGFFLLRSILSRTLTLWRTPFCPFFSLTCGSLCWRTAGITESSSRSRHSWSIATQRYWSRRLSLAWQADYLCVLGQTVFVWRH